MEWLQTYKIGKALLDNKQFEKNDCYYQKYVTQKYKVKTIGKQKTEADKKPYILDIIIDLDKSDVQLQVLELQMDKVDEQLKQSNVFRGTSGRFDSFYVAIPFINKDFSEKIGKSLKYFFLKKEKGKGYDDLYEQMIKEKLLNKDFETSALVSTRKKILSNAKIQNKLSSLLNYDALKALVNKKIEDGKKNEDAKKEDAKRQELVEVGFKALEQVLDLGQNGKETIAYIQVRIIENGLSFYLNKLEEYREICIKRFTLLGKLIESNKTCSFCYFEKKITDVYPVEFPRDSINILKVSTDTTVNYKSNFNGERFLLSKDAFDIIKLGAWYIQKNLIVTIAGIRHYIIPDFSKQFDLIFFRNKIVPQIDLAFQDRNYKETKRTLDLVSSTGLNTLTFIGFKADDRQIEVINRIQTVSPDRFKEVVDSFNKLKAELEQTKFGEWFVRFSFSSISRLFPQSSSREKVPQALIFYKQLLENHLLNKDWVLFQYKKLIHIYHYGNPDKQKKYYQGTNVMVIENRDFAVSIASLKYLILLTMIDELYNKSTSMNEKFIIDEKQKTEKFFNQFAFQSSAKRAMFYLGKLIRRTAEAQFKAQHKHKPILNRINHSGMKVFELQVLSLEVMEKMRQYNKSQSTLNFAQNDLMYFEYYFCKAQTDSWDLSDIENVFYLYTGYGMYFEVSEKREIEALKELGIVPYEQDLQPPQDEKETETEPNPENN